MVEGKRRSAKNDENGRRINLTGFQGVGKEGEKENERQRDKGRRERKRNKREMGKRPSRLARDGGEAVIQFIRAKCMRLC